MNYEQAAISWVALDQLFSAPELRERLWWTFEDESGVLMLRETLTPALELSGVTSVALQAKETSHESRVTLVTLMTEWLTLFYGAAGEVFASASREERAEILISLRSYASKRAPLKRALTVSELQEFLSAADSRRQLHMTNLDQQISAYLILKGYENSQDRSVLELFYELYSSLTEKVA